MTRSRATLTAMILAFVGWPGVALAGPALLFDPANGHVLYAEDADDQWHPASLTKIMTAYLTFEAIRDGKIALGTKIPCSDAAYIQPPSKFGLPVGGELTVEMALQALIVKSANDVAVMLAESVGGTEQAFVEKMNATAQRLGMTRTHFVNANGLPATEQVTTARDLAKLSTAVLRDFPEYREWWGREDMRVGKRRLSTHNGLLKTYEGADGMKTGFTCDSGFNVVASATRDGHQLIAVVLGESSGHERTLRAAGLLEHGFQTQGWKDMFNTSTLDTLPPAAEPKDVISVRSSVVSWDCGGRRPVRVARVKAKKVVPTGETAGMNAKVEPAVAPAAKKATIAQGSAAGSAQATKSKPKSAEVQATKPAVKPQ